MMKTLLSSLGILAVLIGSSISARAEDVLHLYNWNNYMSEETIRRFEGVCKCKVKQTYYSDNDELISKLQAGGKGYDILVPTQNAVEALIKMSALRPIDSSKIPNLKNVMPQYMNTSFDPGNRFSVPYAMSITLIGYNDAKIKELGIPVDSWDMIFNPEILRKVKGKVTVLDSQRELLGAALKYLGYSVNDMDERHLQEAKTVILKAKPYWAAFNASSYIKELTLGNIWVAHGYSNDIFQADLDAKAAKRKFRILHSLPKQGAVLALDSMVIHKSAPRPDLAHLFINFMLDGRNSADLTNMIGSGNPNSDAQQYIKPEIKQIRAVFPDENAAKTLEMLKDLGARQRRAVNTLWTEIKVK
jgi:spermidine/putrescine transport system substrate-binding protein